MHAEFVHLRLHSEYSLIDGIIRVKPLVNELETRGMNAVAITDHCNLFAAVKIFTNAISNGIKPIIGASLPIIDNNDNRFNLLVLCQDIEGYKNLTKLVSKAYLEGQIRGEPTIKKNWLKDHAKGLIALGGLGSDLGGALIKDDLKKAEQNLGFWQEHFPDRFYIELTRTKRPHEDEFNKRAVELAASQNIPIVATNDVHFINEADYDAHEARVCIHDGYTLDDPRRLHRYSSSQYLKSAKQMVELFHDLPEAVANTVEISKRCNVILELGKNYLPDFPVPQGFSIDSFLKKESQAGLEKRLKKLFANDEGKISKNRAKYDRRLEVELKVICDMGFPGYFLIVADFIKWAKNNGVPVGPGRGSGAGSLVAYALDITDLDPLEYDLLFERFLNPERVSMPDFDIDFCMDGRDRVIDYVQEKYGRLAVSQIITFGSMAAKAVVRDVGRVLGHPYAFVDAIAKLIPFELGMTLTKALEQEEELKERYEAEEEVHELIDLGLKLEGITRNAGKHAGGVVIAPSELTDFTAIYCEEGSTQIVSQFDKDDVEAVGLVKFDFLGLRTLTIIDWAIKNIKTLYADKEIDITAIPLDCPKTFAMLKDCNTTAVFQLESRGMKELIGRLQPDCFEDIIALVALFRPGPLQSGMVDDFIDRKHGRAEVEYPHPDLEPILKPTYGVILYQEQVMQIAQVLAGYTLGAADLLRRAMGKKKPEEMAKQREIFTKGAIARGVREDVATYIFDLMEKFAGYGFNKSHSAAYALVAYQTAWLKAHYPAPFMAAVLSSDMDNTDKVVNFLSDCKARGLKVLPPSIKTSLYKFSVMDNKTILYGLGAIKGVGEGAIESIINARNVDGELTNLFDFCKRVDLRKVNRRVMETLIKSGAFDCFNEPRHNLYESIDKALKVSAEYNDNEAHGQYSLFTVFDSENDHENYVKANPWPTKVLLEGEKETLGFYLSGHPADIYTKEFCEYTKPIMALDPIKSKKALVCGMVMQLKKILTKRGKKLVIMRLEDGEASIDIVVFEEVFASFAGNLQTGSVILVEGELSEDTFSGGVKMLANIIYSLEDARIKLAKCMKIKIHKNDIENLTLLESVIKAHKGKCTIQFEYSNDFAKAHYNLGKDFTIKPSDEVIGIIDEMFNEKRVEMCY